MSRSSLMDGISSGPAQKGKAKKSEESKNAMKLTIAVVLLVVAAGVISIYLGWIPTPFTKTEVPPPPTPEQTQAVQQRQQAVEAKIKKGEVITNGSN
jgi:hypothetical protein